MLALALVMGLAAGAQPENTVALRVGTTGDYPPFSQYDPTTNTYTGSDIDLAQALGKQLHRPVVFVLTTWPTLSQDMQSGRFNVALSGISITQARKRIAPFSKPYLKDGKVPLVRCADRQRFRTLSQIDQPGVRVIENPGGTNEAFARKRLRRATLMIHNDNHTVFEAVRQHQADVMFTDSAEAHWQAQQHLDLCVVDPTHRLTHDAKALWISNTMGRAEQQQIRRALRRVMQAKRESYKRH